MEEYKEIMFLYEKSKKKEMLGFWLTGSLILGICLFLYIDIVKLHPVLLFGIGLIVSVVFIIKNQLTSKNYDVLEKYIKKYHKEYKNHLDFLFFLDKQLDKIYQDNQDELKKCLKSKEINEKLSKQIKNSYYLFNSLQKVDKENKLLLDY